MYNSLLVDYVIDKLSTIFKILFRWLLLLKNANFDTLMLLINLYLELQFCLCLFAGLQWNNMSGHDIRGLMYSLIFYNIGAIWGLCSYQLYSTLKNICIYFDFIFFFIQKWITSRKEIQNCLNGWNEWYV